MELGLALLRIEIFFPFFFFKCLTWYSNYKRTLKPILFLTLNISISFFRKQQSMDDDLEPLDPTGGMPKCPSAPNIHQHKLYQRVPSMLVTPASASEHNAHGGRYEPTSARKQGQSILRSDSNPNSRAASSASRVKLSLSPLPPPSHEDHSDSEG